MPLNKVNPAKCRMWEMHDRLADDVNAGRCTSLIASINKHGQKQPVLGRKVSDPAGYEIELIYGARRLFAAQHLGIPLVVDVRAINDRASLIEMDIENRVRDDISPYERGMNYKRWLATGHFSSQAEMAKSLAVSEAQISRLLRYAELPAVIVKAFGSGRHIREEWAVVLAKRCRDGSARNSLIRRARTVAESPESYPPQMIFERLMRDSSKEYVKVRSRDEVVKSAKGEPLLRVGYRAKTVHFIVEREKLTDSSLAEITAALRHALEMQKAAHKVRCAEDDESQVMNTRVARG